MGQDRNVEHLYPKFRNVYALVLKDMQAWLDVHRHGQVCKLIEGFRSAAYQHELWLKRPPVTHANGYTSRSNHQSSMAADVGIFDSKGGYVEEPDEETMQYYGHVVRAHGLEWGGNWRTINDQPHAQWPASDTTEYANALHWQKEAGLA